MATQVVLTNEEAKNVPPYVPYRTFKTFIESLRVSIPSRIDRSVMGSMSGAIQSQLLSAMKYLGLIGGAAGLPTERLSHLVNAEGPEWQKQLRALLSDKYPFLFQSLDLQRATSRQFEEAFSTTGTSSETAKKCMAFFLAAARDADLKLSPHIKPYRGTSQQRAPRVRRAVNGNGNLSNANPPQEPPPAQANAWQEMLLAKFPNFDPAWPDDVKTKWFDAFDKLMSRAQGGPE